MADETTKLYTSKIKIGGNVYYLKDNDARSLISVLNGASTVDGSVLNSIKLYAKDADYGETTLGTALGVVEGKIETLNGDKTSAGSVKHEVYTETKNALYSSTPAVTREATSEDVNAGLATEVGETIIVTPAKVKTIAEAIAEAAASIGNLTVNGVSPDSNDDIVIDASNIKRQGSETDTVESTLAQAEADIDAVEGRLNTLEGDASKIGSVDNKILTQAKDAIYDDTETWVITANAGYHMENGEAVLGDGPRTEVVTSDPGELANAQVVKKSKITIAQAISNLESKVGEDTTALRKDIDTNTSAIEVLNGEVGTAGSVKDTVFNKAGDATFTFAGAETATTIKAAIQANADAIEAVNNGKITVVTQLPSAGEDCAKTIYLVPKTASVENGGKGAEEGTPGYIEWVCLGDVDGNHNWEEIGDTDIDLTDYATHDWVTKNAKDAIYKEATTNEVNGEVPAKTIAQALDELFSKVAEGTQTLRNDLNAEIERATIAEEALDGRVTANETAIETLNSGVEVAGSVSNSIREQAKDATYIEATESTEKVTISEAIAANAKAISDESARAKSAEEANTSKVEALGSRVDELETKVTGTTVKSVNGIEATVENGGAITVGAANIDYTNGVTVADAIDDLDTRTSALENAELSMQVNGVDAIVTKDGDNTGVSVTIDAKNIKMDKESGGSVSIFDKISKMLSSTATAITSVSVKSGTGTWSVDADDAEMLDWSDIELNTSDATFLVPSAE